MSEPELQVHIAEKVAEATREQVSSIKKNVWWSSLIVPLGTILGLVYTMVQLGGLTITAGKKVEVWDALPTRMSAIERMVGPLPGEIKGLQDTTKELPGLLLEIHAAQIRMGKRQQHGTRILDRIAGAK